MKGVLVLGLLALVALTIGEEAEKPIVDTHYGKVQGDTSLSRDGRMFYQFKGIPYAKAPQRFQAPEIPDNWEGVKDATEYGPKCPQYNPKSGGFQGSEDCLSLNVFTPKLPKEGDHKVLLPVVVMLHPGGPSLGSSKIFGPKYFMDEEVILVSLNSRLGPFGYLNTGDMYAQGNQGIKDQSAALRWVMYNIEKFGGDKGRVTLLGSSIGGSDVLLHTLNPMSKGLFHNAVVQSGSPLHPVAFIRDPIAQAKKLGVQAGCPVDTSKALIECLKAIEPLELLKKMKMLKPEEFNMEEVPKFGASIENILEGQTEKDVVLADAPAKLFMSGKIINKVPLIMGANDQDGLYYHTGRILNSTEALSKLNDKWEEFAPKILFYEKTAKDPIALSKKLREFYFGDKEIGVNTRDKLIDIYQDRYFGSIARFAGKYYTKHAPLYLYLFKHKPLFSSADIFGFDKELKKGAANLDELQYLFTAPKELKVPEITKDSDKDELTLSKGMVALWSSFFENAKPTKTWGEGKEWKKVETPEKPKWYKIDLETKMIDEPEYFSTRADFWQQLYQNELKDELETPPKENF